MLIGRKLRGAAVVILLASATSAVANRSAGTFAIADHYQAQVRVMHMNGAGRAVIPIRGRAPATVEEGHP